VYNELSDTGNEMANTARRLDVHEIFSKVVSTKSRKDKIKILQDNNIMPVRDVLQGTFDDRIQWNLPPGTPPYTPQSEGAPAPQTLLKLHLKFKYFVKGLRESEDLLPVKRERMFLDILESIDSRDAEILVNMINKKPPMQGITKKLVQEAYPDLLPE
jgi:hypothetical protein